MALNNTIQAAEQYLKAAWQAIDDRSGVLPSELNMKNLPEAILSIHGGVGDLGKFQRDLRLDYAAAQEKYPIGTEFEDEWDGVSAPLILVNYQKVQATDGELKDGAILQRRYPTEKVFASSSAYPAGFDELSAYLGSEYYEKSSEMVKSVIQEIIAPIDTNNAIRYTSGKWFAPTGTNVCFYTTTGTGAVNEKFAYWRVLTGGGASIMDLPTRIVRTQDGTAVNIELYGAGSFTSSSTYTLYLSTRGGSTVGGVSPRTLPCMAIF